MRLRYDKNKCISQRLLGALDLAIDFATLGEYGLEPLPAQMPANGRYHADGPRRERPGPQTGWEAFAKARRGDCDPGDRAATKARRRAQR